MIFAKSHIDLHNIRNNVERVKKLSDNIVGVGPLGIGLDGLLIVVQIIAIIVIDTVSGALPGAGKIVDVLFTGHKWSADMLTKHMDDTIYFEGARKDMQGSQEYRELLSRIQAGKEKRRVVFLG